MSGFYSKENIIESSYYYSNEINIYISTIIGALLTTIYSFKLLINTFNSNFNSSNSSILKFDFKEIPYSLNLSFFILIFGSIFIGFLFKDFFIGFGLNNNKIGIDIEFYPLIIKLIPIFMIIIGFLLNFIKFDFYKFYLINVFFNRRAFFDPIFNYFISLPIFHFGFSFSFKLLDKGFLDYFGPLGFISPFMDSSIFFI